MRPGELLLSALHGISANALRSILTLLGVMIGVAAVILLLAVGNGSAQQVSASIDSLGTNTLTVRPDTAGAGGGQAATASATRPITVTTASSLEHAGLGDVSKVVPEVSSSQTVATTTASETGTSVIGTTPGYFQASAARIAEGSSFSDASTGTPEAVLGQTLAQELFGGDNAVGRNVTVGGVPFAVSGVLGEQTATGFNDPNSEIVLPVAAVQRSFVGYGSLSGLLVSAKSATAVPAAEGEIQVELDQLVGATAADSPFTITSPSALLQTRQQSAQSFTVLLAAVAAISLLVGGIGVTNVMLVTVTERTREIGIRKAVGATRRSIAAQFLVEAAALTLTGGALGVIVAIIGTRFPIDGTTPILVLSSIPLALGVSVAIGVFFGVYPALRAASMRPIHALRSI